VPVAASTVNEQIEAALCSDPLRFRECMLWAIEAKGRMFAPDEEWAVPWVDLLAQGRRTRHQLALGALLSCLDGMSPAWVVARLPSGPLPDEELRGNRRLLAELPAPFSASLYCANDEDGAVQWAAPLGVRVFDEAAMKSLPLEVGYVDPGTLFMHLVLSGGFFRWPYGSSWLYGCVADAAAFWAWRRRML